MLMGWLGCFVGCGGLVDVISCGGGCPLFGFVVWILSVCCCFVL